MIVADANLVAYFYLPGRFQPLAQRVLQKDPVWLVPPIMMSEFRNIVLNYVRLRKFHKQDAVDLAARVDLVFRQRMRDVPVALVMDLACASGCSAYDCEYVALAQVLKTQLVTNDKALLKAFPHRAVSLGDFV